MRRFGLLFIAQRTPPHGVTPVAMAAILSSLRSPESASPPPNRVWLHHTCHTSTLGLVKDRPSIVSPAASTQRLPSGESPPRVIRSFRPRRISRPRRFTPLLVCGFIAPRIRSWGSHRFTLSRSPDTLVLPPKFSPFAQRSLISAHLGFDAAVCIHSVRCPLAVTFSPLPGPSPHCCCQHHGSIPS